MRDRLIKIIKELVEEDIDFNITSDIDLIDDVGFDSITIIQLIVSIETEFNIELEDYELMMQNIRKLNYLVELLEKKVQL